MINQKMGDYTISKSLGQGGFGSVYQATAGDGNRVALKILNPQVLENEKVVRKFFHEAMILAKLDHRHICKLLEFFPDGSNYAIVMEYVEGSELKKILSQHPVMPFNMAYKVAMQILDAFQYAHENGILHRDIKPANIMVDNEGNSKIMDFGIAKMSSTASHDTAANMLSVHYVPPERFDKSREIDARSDIYSLGLVFYEMFAGRRPFDATETSQIMFAHLNEIPEPPISYQENLPERISDAISKALEKDPDDRFDDFKAFKDALELDEETVEEATTILEDSTQLVDQTILSGGRQATAAPQKQPPARKSKALITAICVALLAAAGIGGYLYFDSQKGTGGGETTATTAKPTVAKPVVAKPVEAPIGDTNAKGFSEVEHPADGATMVMVPAGEFTMGSDQYSAERPVQTVGMDKYFIDKYLVTNAQFGKFVQDSGYTTDAEKAGSGMVRIGRRWKKVEGASWRTPDGLTAAEGREDHPVSQVSYTDARSYCQWAKKDLPTEAQWEKAARGPSGNNFPWGNGDPDDTKANFDNLVGSTTPVTRYEKGQSHFGIFDMAGNVYQWCRDWYAVGQRTASNPIGPDTGKEHVIKGGSFIEGIESLRSANRDRYTPEYSSFLFGFRCASTEMPEK